MRREIERLKGSRGYWRERFAWAEQRRERAEAVLRELVPWAEAAFNGLEAEAESEREELWERLAGPADEPSPLSKARAIVEGK